MASNFATIQNHVVASDNAFLTQPSQGLTVVDVVNDILLTWGITTPASAPKYQLTRAVHDMNAALQMVWSMAKDDDYFSRQTLTVTFASGVTQQTLPVPILAILGPARFSSNNQPLMPISSRSQYDSYGPIFIGQLGFAVANGTPQAFWIEKLNSASPDNVSNIMHIIPAASVQTSFLLDVSTQAPRYVFQDYLTATPVQFPNLYADSVLLPICRYKAMSSFLLANPDVRPSLVADYQNALRLIGAVDPTMKEVEFADRSTDRN